MTPKEKAEEIYKKMLGNDGSTHPKVFGGVKRCALIAVDEIINSIPLEPTDVDWDDSGGTHQYWYESRQEKAMIFWQEVKQEIEKL